MDKSKKIKEKKEASKLFNAVSMPFKGAKFLFDKAVDATWLYIWPLPDDFSSKKKFFFGFKRTALATAFVLVAQPLTGTFFKTGQEYLEENNVNGDIALELSGGVVPHVRERDFKGMFHSMLDSPNIFNAVNHYNNALHPYNAYAFPNIIGLNSCNVTAIGDMGDKFDNLDATYYTRLLSRDINHIEISKEEFQLYVMFHEFAHCNPENIALEAPFIEADADYRAIKAIEKIKPDSKIADFVMAFRSTALNGEVKWSHGADHDTVLYLDAKLNEKELPKIEDIRKANVRAMQLINSDILVINKLAHYKLDSLSRQRVELYLSGMKYFNSGAKIKTPKSSKNLSM